MKKRSPIAVFCFGFITVIFYSWYWSVKTKGEMNKMGEKIPTAFIWLIPIVGSIWWTWKYSEGVEHVTNEKLSGVLAFIVLWLLGPIGNAIVQDYFNKVETSPVPTAAGPIATPQTATIAPAQPVATVTPTATPQTTITPTSVPKTTTTPTPQTTIAPTLNPVVQKQQPPNPPIVGG